MILILIPLCAMAGIAFAEISGIPQTFSNWLFDKFGIGRTIKHSAVKIPLRFKPFDCAFCLSFWVCFSLNLYLDNMMFVSVVYGLASAYLSILLKKLL